jgi:site-specific DNA-methyltransferase (adenine-specific)
MIKLLHGDCLKLLHDLEDNSIDAIITDPPYGTTACKWDTIIPFDEMWRELNRVIKNNGAIVLFGSEPFSSHLRMSNIKNYKYDWIWVKSTSAGFIHAKNMPMKRTENISVFSLSSMGHQTQLGNKRMNYNPQDLVKINRTYKRLHTNCVNVIGKRPSHKLEFTSDFTNYPKNILNFARGNNKNVHPTQKPVALLEYLVKTYTLEGETVLDFTMGSGSTGVACVNTNRNFIGIELDEKYFDIATSRINDATLSKENQSNNISPLFDF